VSLLTPRAGGKVFALALDIVDQSKIDSIIPSIEKAGLPPVDVLVNNVGVFCFCLTLYPSNRSHGKAGWRCSRHGKGWGHRP
jgi:NAD(P)-dependent dehydrogenase (short-subunit alcohol dehydrogenase family)